MTPPQQFGRPESSCVVRTLRLLRLPGAIGSPATPVATALGEKAIVQYPNTNLIVVPAKAGIHLEFVKSYT